MSESALGVVAVGNALVDVLAQVDDAFLDEQCTKYGMERGAMTLIDEKRAVELYTQMPKGLETSGGSAANTMAGYSSFGGHGAFIGKVAKDALGETFNKDMLKIGVDHLTRPLVAGPPTGRCMILVSPDGHRTMNTFLGASVELSPQDIEPDVIFSAQITYLEGYLFDRELAKRAFIRAAELAHKAGHRVALTLSDPFCVDRHRHDFLNLVQNHVDILFANEEEIKSLYMQQNFEDAKSAVNSHCEIAVLTRSEKGAVIVSQGREIMVPAAPVKKVVDTTGAGDQFAAGFLFGFTHARTLEECGRLGALAAAEVISHIGPRPQKSLRELMAA
ncbi:MAG: adenosine kinase [Alphaproteobacteria bacterium]|jgi:sugar/nucleoside kinase (ribokinase family)|nr:adenosine kinase [Alphaproteobacteria bacterium]QQS56741.1 MAG: adenosine kinase [Alphaproteobacteria bacterium]